ncbi:MAG: hypothetical protein AAB855_01710 [Patescibacteria group bacterium]
MDRRYLLDRVPKLDLHPDDETTFLEKLEGAFPEEVVSSEEVVPVLAWILCEALGEDPTEMSSLFSFETRRLIYRDGIIVRDKGIDDVVRACLRDQLQISPWVDEVSDEQMLDRMGALIAAAIASFVSRAVPAGQAASL